MTTDRPPRPFKSESRLRLHEPDIEYVSWPNEPIYRVFDDGKVEVFTGRQSV